MTASDKNGTGISSVRIKVHDALVTPERLDRFLADCPDLDLTRSRIQKLVTDGLVLVDGKTTSKKHLVKGGEIVVITVPSPPKTLLQGENIPLDIAYEDEYPVVVNKPAGMVTHPAPGNYGGTLVNAMIHHFGKLSDAGDPDRPGIVHRLDKNTSGLLIVARDDRAFLKLQEAVQERKVTRIYLALVCGHMQEESGLIELPIGRSLKDRKKMIVTTVKSITAHKMFEAHPHIKTQLWGGKFWTAGYYINTVGQHGNEDVIQRYVQNQGKNYKKIYRNDLQLSLF